MLWPRARVSQALLLSFLCLCVSVVSLSAGCSRKDPAKSKSASESETGYVPPPTVTPDYTFADGLREQYPAPAAFVQQFLETCLAGDYAGYRLLSSRRREPESRERFTAIYHGIRSLHVDLIEPRNVPELSDQVYVIVCRVEFPPDSKVKLRRKTDRVAILAFREEGEWRMLPAPAELQPRADAASSQSSSGPSSASMPSYPWDEESP
jgi:hypothetical protein